MSFHWTGREGVRADLTRPSARAIHDLGSLECGLGGGYAGGASIDHRDFGDFIAGRKVYTMPLGRFPGSGGERSGIDAALL